MKRMFLSFVLGGISLLSSGVPIDVYAVAKQEQMTIEGSNHGE